MKRTAKQEYIYRKHKLEMYKRDGWACKHCNSRSELTPHHIVHQSQLGSDDLDNLLTLCVRCHNAVHDGFLKVWFSMSSILVGKVKVIKFKRLKGWTP